MSTIAFESPATTWLECLPLGNGTIGAMLDGGLNRLQVELNHEHGWSGSPTSEARGVRVDQRGAANALAAARAALSADDPAHAEAALSALQARYSQAFLPLGRLVVHRAVKGDGYRRELDLETAIHRLTTTEFTERAVVSAPRNMLAIETAVQPTIELESSLLEISRTRKNGVHELVVRFPSDVAPPHEPDVAAAEWDDHPGAALHGVLVATVRPSGNGWLVLLTAETTFVGYDQPLGSVGDARARARARLDAVDGWSARQIFDEASADHDRLFSRCRLQIDAPAGPPSSTPRRFSAAFTDPEGPLAADPSLVELLFDFGRYLLISSSRPGTTPPTLQGIWNKDVRPMWSSNYTLNINLQMNYWSAHTTNLSATAEPLLDYVEELARAGRATARDLYGAAGWTAHHNSDLWLFSSPVGMGRGDARWVHWPMASAWLVRSLWDAAEFGALDARQCERLWTITEGAAQFVLDWQHRDGTGWSTSPATSPENTYFDHDGREVAVDGGTAMDEQLVYDVLEICIELAGLTGHADGATAARARTRLASLRAEPAVTADGIVREWSADRVEADPHHRHLSPLYGLFPGPGKWSRASREAATRTLERRGDESTGWALIWRMFLWARLGRADKVSDLLALVFRPATDALDFTSGGIYPNCFAAHPPFQIDANLAFPGAFAECLVQSTGSVVLLPSLPREVPSGLVTGLVARPGIEVDIKWANGDLVTAVLRAKRRGLVEVEYRNRSITIELNGTVSLDPASFSSEQEPVA